MGAGGDPYFPSYARSGTAVRSRSFGKPRRSRVDLRFRILSVGSSRQLHVGYPGVGTAWPGRNLEGVEESLANCHSSHCPPEPRCWPWTPSAISGRGRSASNGYNDHESESCKFLKIWARPLSDG